MPLENLEPALELAKYDNIAIRVLVVACGVLILGNIAQWLAAIKAKDQYREDVQRLADKYDAGVKHAFSYVDKISAAVEKAVGKIELLLDRAKRD